MRTIGKLLLVLAIVLAAILGLILTAMAFALCGGKWTLLWADFEGGGVESRHARIRRDGTGRINPPWGFFAREKQLWRKPRHSGCTDSSRSSARPALIPFRAHRTCTNHHRTYYRLRVCGCAKDGWARKLL